LAVGVDAEVLEQTTARTLKPIAAPFRKRHPDRVPRVGPTIKARWVCEQAHQQLKEELGLDHFEGRSWRGLHRHALMAMIAYAFLQHLRLAAASGGKKNLRRPASTDTAGHTKSRHRRPGAPSALPMPALPPASPETAQLKVPK
jgi:hypothetical protein